MHRGHKPDRFGYKTDEHLLEIIQYITQFKISCENAYEKVIAKSRQWNKYNNCYQFNHKYTDQTGSQNQKRSATVTEFTEFEQFNRYQLFV